MATLTRKDLRDVFILLAVMYAFDAIANGFFVTAGLVVVILMAALLWLSTSEYSGQVESAVGSLGSEMVFRAAVVLTFLGVLVNNFIVVAAGFLIGEILLFSPEDSVDIDLLGLKLEQSQKKGK